MSEGGGSHLAIHGASAVVGIPVPAHQPRKLLVFFPVAEFEATTRRFQQILESMGISKALNEAGVAEGDTVYIGDEVLEWGE